VSLFVSLKMQQGDNMEGKTMQAHKCSLEPRGIQCYPLQVQHEIL